MIFFLNRNSIPHGEAVVTYSSCYVLQLLCQTSPQVGEDMRGEATATNSEGNGMGQGTGSRQGVRIASRNIWLGSEGEIGGKM